jgi:hypothetical protein
MMMFTVVAMTMFLVGVVDGSLHVPSSSKVVGKVFHPAFPNFFMRSVPLEEAQRLAKVKDALRSGEDNQPDFSCLPWKVFPALGISDKQTVWSRSQIEEAYEKNKHNGYYMWAEKIDRPEKGCILLNHWSQKAILLTDYDLERGAKGYEIRGQSGATAFFNWPPLSLEYELTEKNSRWQPVRVSDNISNGDIFTLLPAMMTKSAWELIFLLLLSEEDPAHADVLQALFDTGLCPRQGLIAYMRLLEQVEQRSESWEGIPQYRKIVENEILI